MKATKNFIIRKMESKDVPQAHEIEKKCFTDAWSPNLLYKELENDLAYYVVVMDGETMAAYLGVWFIMDDTQIMSVAVEPSYQGQGIGNLMMEHLHEVSEQKDIFTMSLEVRVSNYKAINLYEKFGFEIITTRKQYYQDNKEDAYIMYKYLR